jgi:DNA-binding Lrp family transcriptional regulator
MEEKVIKRLNRLKETGVIKDYAIGGAHAVAYYLEPHPAYASCIY